MKQKKIEIKSLMFSFLASLSIIIIGLYTYKVTNIQIVFLDFFFTFIALLSSLIAIFITNISKIKTKTYPHGLYFLRPLYIIFKSLITIYMLILSLSITLIKTYKYFVYKIIMPINTNVLLGYLIYITIITFSLGVYQKKQNNKINNMSSLLTLESHTNFIDSMQSLGILLIYLFLSIIDINSKLGFLYYVIELFIIVLIVLISIKHPFKSLISSFRELTFGIITNNEIIDNIINSNLNMKNKKYNIYKLNSRIIINIIILEKLNNYIINELEVSRVNIIEKLKKYYDNIEIIFIF